MPVRVSAALCWAALVFGALSTSRAAEAQEAPWRADFVKEAKPADIQAAFPKAAYDQKITGEVALTCIAGPAGELTDCKIVHEEPAGFGFGAAGLSLTGKERIAPKDASGASVAGRSFKTYYEFLAPGDANPDWLRKPTAESLAAAFPTKALRDGRAGKAMIKCNVTIEGFLERCTILSETPADYGFGSAALQLSPQFRMSPRIRGGKPVTGGQVSIPINWPSPPGGGGNDATFGSRRLLLDPPWASVPTFQQVRAAWPQEAKGEEAGQAALRCAVSGEGALKDCEVISEIPKGKGFGRAAKTLSRDFRINVRPEDAKIVKTFSVDVPFRFRDPAAPDTRKLTSPRWTTTLTAEGMASVYPAAAIKAGVFKGLGVVACAVDIGGHLVDCSATRESPAALDFGAAAVAAARLMAMNPWTKEGDTVDGMHLTLPIAFNYEPDAEPVATPPAAAPPPAKP